MKVSEDVRYGLPGCPQKLFKAGVEYHFTPAEEEFVQSRGLLFEQRETKPLKQKIKRKRAKQSNNTASKRARNTRRG